MAQRASGPIMAHSTASIYPAAAAASGADSAVRPAWLEVDLGAIRRNAERLQAAAGRPIVAMIKADGYGCGAIAVARTLVPMGDRLWGFGIATLAEAAALRDAGIHERLLCPTPLLPSELDDAHRLKVRPALHRAADIRAWAATGAPWHLSIDTGMSRAGIRWDDVSSLVPVLAQHAPEGVFTHFHSAEMRNGSQELQASRFEQALGALNAARVLDEGVLVHRDNSAGIASRVRSSGLSPGGLARCGIGIYGAVVAAEMRLEQTVHVRARVIDLRDVHEGETVSYCGEWQATGTHRIATVAVGHGDGYRRAFSGKGIALLHGAEVPVIGIVTMDMTMIDVTAMRCGIGDVVTFIGSDGARCLSTDDVAARGGLSPYELLVGLRLRLPRVYRESTTEEHRGTG
jgi:alanine racemase